VGDPSKVLEPEIEIEKSTGAKGPRIRCPKCGWSPKKTSRWQCTC